MTAAGEEWDGGWAESRLAQLRLWSRATPADRIAWLEQAIALAHELGALPRRADPTGHPLGGQSDNS